MKIMRRVARFRAGMLQRDAPRLPGQPLSGCPGRTAGPVRNRRTTMKWETPQASDHRYGFEVTMYIANR